jgi:hypothetical protein
MKIIWDLITLKIYYRNDFFFPFQINAVFFLLFKCYLEINFAASIAKKTI